MGLNIRRDGALHAALALAADALEPLLASLVHAANSPPRTAESNAAVSPYRQQWESTKEGRFLEAEVGFIG